MKILGIDYGRRRIGVAICGLLKIANPLTIIKCKDQDNGVEQIVALVEEHDVVKIVIGLPKNMDNTEGEMVKEVKIFAEKIKEKCEVEVDFSDERLSTWEAKNSLKSVGISNKKQKKMLDAVAASLILQNYVDQKK